MGTSHSVVTALRLVLRQCGLKIATKTIEGFVKEIDCVALWYVLRVINYRLLGETERRSS